MAQWVPGAMSDQGSARHLPIQHSNESRWPLTLIGLEVLLLICEVCAIGAHRDNHFYWVLFWLLISGIPFVLAIWWTFQRTKFPAKTLVIILIGGALFRVILIPLNPPRLSTDVYRYISDGRVQSAGINPYLYLPADTSLAQLRANDIYPNINPKTFAHTLYPPVQPMFVSLVTHVTL